jgi:hypothetical protein
MVEIVLVVEDRALVLGVASARTQQGTWDILRELMRQISMVIRPGSSKVIGNERTVLYFMQSRISFDFLFHSIVT